MDSLPYAMAAMAWAAPTLNIGSTPAFRAAARTAGMMAVECKGAEPAGTYRPTARIGTLKRSQITPGDVSTRSGGEDCAAWKRRTFSIARSIAACCSAVTARSASANSCSVTASVSRRTPSYCCVSASSAASPSRRTRSMMSRAAALTPAASASAGRCRASHCAAVDDEFQSRILITLSQHFLDRQNQYRGGARTLQVLERLPEDIFAAHRVNRYPIAQSFQEYD